MAAKRHVVRVMRPPTNLDSRGHPQGNAEVVYEEWPCEIKNLTGRELEFARSRFATATLQVSGWGDPARPFKETDYLEFTDGTETNRKLNIGTVDDEMQNGIHIILTCGERPGA
jgi:hypothetical protein